MVLLNKRKNASVSNSKRTQVAYNVGAVCTVLSASEKNSLVNFSTLLMTVANRVKNEAQQQSPTLPNKIGLLTGKPIDFINNLYLQDLIDDLEGLTTILLGLFAEAIFNGGLLFIIK